MTAPTIDAPPPRPDPLDPRTFATRGVVFAQWLATFRTQLVAALDYIDTTIAPLAGSVAGAAASAGDAAISAGQALAERLLAQAFAEAAQVAAGVYDTIAEGRAAVADGEYFKVIAEGSDELESLTLFRRDSDSTQTVIMTFVSGDDFDAAADARIGAAIGETVQGWSESLDILGETEPTAAGIALLQAANPGTQRTALGVAIGSDVQAYAASLAQIAGLTPSNDNILQRKSGAWTNRTPAQLKADLALAKGDVGLGNADNTSDAGKPVSSAQQTALDAKLPHTGGTLTDYRIAYLDKGDSGAGTVTLNWASANVQRVRRTGAFTLAFSDIPAAGARAELEIEAVNWGAGTVTLPTLYYILPDGSETTSFSTYGVALQVSGTDRWYLWTREGSSKVYARVLR